MINSQRLKELVKKIFNISLFKKEDIIIINNRRIVVSDVFSYKAFFIHPVDKTFLSSFDIEMMLIEKMRHSLKYPYIIITSKYGGQIEIQFINNEDMEEHIKLLDSYFNIVYDNTKQI